MRFDLRDLNVMHPLLPPAAAAAYAMMGAVALERRGHVPQCVLVVDFCDGEPDSSAVIAWQPVPRAVYVQLDRRRVTEDGAEAVALALVATSRQWVVRRRLQRGEYADWLLIDPDLRLVALEVSGIDGVPNGNRLSEKMRQVTQSDVAALRSACVVAFDTPAVALAEVSGP
jgi:hypothetical protein